MAKKKKGAVSVGGADNAAKVSGAPNDASADGRLHSKKCPWGDVGCPHGDNCPHNMIGGGF